MVVVYGTIHQLNLNTANSAAALLPLKSIDKLLRGYAPAGAALCERPAIFVSVLANPIWVLLRPATML